MKNKTYININSKGCDKKFQDAFLKHLSSIKKPYDEICVTCIGTDRSTGDSLGPLVGYKLKTLNKSNVIGCLNDPVHAKNLVDIVKEIPSNKLIIAVDACLGSMKHVGYITVGIGSIKPGSGIGKDLPPVGDVYIIGIVNFGGFMDFLILQNTRLSIVMKMADIISKGVAALIK